jgi:prohibitin 1
MAAQFFNRIGQLGLGVALAAGVVNSALYNGICHFVIDFLKL